MNLSKNITKAVVLIAALVALIIAALNLIPPNGRELAVKLKKNVVRITVTQNSGQVTGFGFVVGERDNKLYVATAKHVILGKDSPDMEIKKIEAEFFEEQGKRFRALHLDIEKKGIDLALLEVPKPFPGYEWEKDVFCFDYGEDDEVWFVGRENEWWVPSRKLTGSINRIDSVDATIRTDIISVRPGTSGAPLLTKNGIVGMIVEDGNSMEAFAVQIDKIRQLVQGWNYPWNKREVRTTETTTTTRPTSTTRATTATVPPNSPITNSIGMKFVYIQPGSFMMGSPESEPKRDDDEKQHKVRLTKGFHMQTTEVTQGQWKAVMGSNPSGFKDCGNDCPVEQVSWNDVQKFIKKLNKKEKSDKYRLPTEAEWEYAARAGTSTAFSFGKCLSTDQANYDGRYPLKNCPKGEYRRKTLPVASFAPNAWGLHDMHGNVWEWCQDWYGEDYPSGAVTDPGGPSTGSVRVLRGGSWRNGAGYCRAAVRYRDTPDVRFRSIGFRLVRLPGQ